MLKSDHLGYEKLCNPITVSFRPECKQIPSEFEMKFEIYVCYSTRQNC